MTNRPGGGHSAIMRLHCCVVSLTAVIGFNTVGAYLSVSTQGAILLWKSQIGEDKLQQQHRYILTKENTAMLEAYLYFVTHF